MKLYHFIVNLSLVLFIIPGVAAENIYRNTEDTYELNIEALLEESEKVVEQQRVPMAEGTSGYLVLTVGKRYQTEYLVIGPIGQPQTQVLEVISAALDEEPDIINKNAEQCGFEQCLSYDYLIKNEEHLVGVESSILFVYQERLYHLSATVIHLVDSSFSEGEKWVITEAQRRLNLLMSEIRFR